MKFAIQNLKIRSLFVILLGFVLSRPALAHDYDDDDGYWRHRHHHHHHHHHHHRGWYRPYPPVVQPYAVAPPQYYAPASPVYVPAPLPYASIPPRVVIDIPPLWPGFPPFGGHHHHHGWR